MSACKMARRPDRGNWYVCTKVMAWMTLARTTWGTRSGQPCLPGCLCEEFDPILSGSRSIVAVGSVEHLLAKIAGQAA